ncbi:MAG: hypothetical protein K2I96_05615 [Lachnospiraceae bacterium]|nr:hypothetical protein [Lachnospiraceae bacterium]
MKFNKKSKSVIFITIICSIIVCACFFATGAYASTSTNKEIETIEIKQLSLQPASHEEYGQYSFKKGDVVSVDISWNESGNVYFAIGKEFGDFRGLESSGRSSTSFNTEITIKEDGEYYIFLGIQRTENKSVEDITGEISYPIN